MRDREPSPCPPPPTPPLIHFLPSWKGTEEMEAENQQVCSVMYHLPSQAPMSHHNHPRQARTQSLCGPQFPQVGNAKGQPRNLWCFR